MREPGACWHCGAKTKDLFCSQECKDLSDADCGKEQEYPNEEVIVQTTSIKPSIEEGERFIKFLDDKFNLKLPNTLIFTIEQKSEKLKGYFMPSLNPSAYTIEQSKTALNTITLNTLYLKDFELSPYQTITHEIAHFLNNIEGIKDCSSNQYHNKKFKNRAEKLLLIVEKTESKGYSYTKLSPELEKAIVDDFKPSPNAFNIFQHITKKKKSKSRNLLFICGCGVKIRTAKNEDNPLNATCNYCDSLFIEQFKDDDEGENDN